jgi:hypothetical protein
VNVEHLSLAGKAKKPIAPRCFQILMNSSKSSILMPTDYRKRETRSKP